MKLYGFGVRGIAVNPHDDADDDDDVGVIPLYRTKQEVQSVIDRINAKRGKGSLHVIEYEVREA